MLYHRTVEILLVGCFLLDMVRHGMVTFESNKWAVLSIILQQMAQIHNIYIIFNAIAPLPDTLATQ